MIRWRYIGRGEALLDIPARDIYADDQLTAAQVAMVSDSALYQLAGDAPSRTRGKKG